MPCHGLWKLYVRTCLNLSLSPQCKGNRLPLKSHLCVCVLSVPIVEHIRVSAKVNILLLAVFFFPSPEACLAESHSIAGGREG